MAKVTHLDRGWAESAPQAQQALPIMVWGCVCSLCDSGALPQLGELCVCVPILQMGKLRHRAARLSWSQDARCALKLL